MILLYELVGSDATRPFSPHAWKVRMALAHKGLAYRTVPTTFLGIAQIEGGVAKTIPVIRDGDAVVVDSFEIARYLDKTYPDRPTLFGGSGGEAAARFIERWSFTQLHSYLGSAALLEIYERLDGAAKVISAKAARSGSANRSKAPPAHGTSNAKPSSKGLSRCGQCWSSSPSSAAKHRSLQITSFLVRFSGCG